MRVMHVQGRDVRLGDLMLVPDVGRSTVSVCHVSTLSLIGDDVEINGFFATSLSNLVTVEAR